ncbi:hypothetical protein BHE74_00056177 [Ensete ventricosum]|nr:hypothetical protein BHE74_00056177 [Ensete ventricosum]
MIYFLFFYKKEDEIMHVTLQKRDKGQTWSSPIHGQGALDPYSADLEQKRLMLQRFQEESHQALISSFSLSICRIQVSTSLRLNSLGLALTQGPSWEARARIEILYFDLLALANYSEHLGDTVLLL